MKPVRCACDSGDNARTMPRPTVTTNLQAGHCESGLPVPQRGNCNRICTGLVAAAGCMRAPVADSGRKDRRVHGGADGIRDVHAWELWMQVVSEKSVTVRVDRWCRRI